MRFKLTLLTSELKVEGWGSGPYEQVSPTELKNAAIISIPDPRALYFAHDCEVLRSRMQALRVFAPDCASLAKRVTFESSVASSIVIGV